MPGDYGPENYQDGPPTQDRVSSPDGPRDGEDGRQGEGDHGEPQLINDAICPDAEVGTEFVVRVEKKMEGQLLVSYSDKPKDEEAGEPGEPGKAEMPSSPRDTEMSSFME
jgi:hypothetical protein